MLSEQLTVMNNNPAIAPLLAKLEAETKKVEGQMAMIDSRADAMRELDQNKTKARIEAIETTRGNFLQDIARIESASRDLGLALGSNDNLLISTAVTRVGSIILLIFLVRFLVIAYKYGLRLACFYDSRADALILSSSKDTKNLEEMVRVFSSESLEFEKGPSDANSIATQVIQGITNAKS